MIEKWEDKYGDVMEHEIVTSQQIQRWQDEEIELLREEVERLRGVLNYCKNIAGRSEAVYHAARAALEKP